MTQRYADNRIPIYLQIRKRARQIVSRFPVPDFYKDFERLDELSRQLFKGTSTLAELLIYVKQNIDDDFGHGLQHSVKVAIDAGTLMLIEGGQIGYSEKFTERRVLIAQCAGLLHDIKRKQKSHAVKGADYARELLKGYQFQPAEIEDICNAIQNHEAFLTDTAEINTRRGALVSDCLYDADKFRWGPDNFTDTVWDMVLFYNPPLIKFMERYPKGMESLVKIKSTFRTNTGKEYGPQFIDIGLAIGEKLYAVIKKEFARYL